MPAANITKLTLDYSELEDRIRIDAQVPEGSRGLWLTRRLGDRLVPVLAQAVARADAPQVGAPPEALVEQSWQQLAARAALKPDRPVPPAPQEAFAIVTRIDVQIVGGGFRLLLFATGDFEAVLGMTPLEVRQVLGLLHQQYQRGGWSTESWPRWVADPSAAFAGSGTANTLQ